MSSLSTRSKKRNVYDRIFMLVRSHFFNARSFYLPTSRWSIGIWIFWESLVMTACSKNRWFRRKQIIRQALRLTVNIRRDSLSLWLLVNIYLNFCAKCLRNVYKKITIVYKLLTYTSLITMIHVYVVTLILVTICSTAYCLLPPW